MTATYTLLQIMDSKRVANVPEEKGSPKFLLFSFPLFHSSASAAIWRGFSESENDHCQPSNILAAHKIQNSLKLTGSRLHPFFGC